VDSLLQQALPPSARILSMKKIQHVQRLKKRSSLHCLKQGLDKALLSVCADVNNLPVIMITPLQQA